ncbi:hypothetical protein GCM10010185_57810 [Saccharothrix coeruleofusca]|uniref:Uncharacterized protein n=1 Tax=Saccharothrix coeruleofusca TaxID=33919 RepID=A0A918EFT8_9PSEU|nr:hypothetical protein GCM10010185_57810 [Saccharothrix coeruleofusca]
MGAAPAQGGRGAFRGWGSGYRTGMEQTAVPGPEEDSDEAKPATEQEEGLGEEDSSLPDQDDETPERG